ncbi:hypothetical protein BJY52DRAFT_1205662 [Lactarius psammicola]|nr:hypothetical protein BJY52DRAFT_1205662 [Lactarius psammicola]
MAIKRKFDIDTVAESDRCSKQLRLVPFPSYQADADVAMSDASSDVSPVEPIITEQHHMRLDSGVSTASSSDYGDVHFEAHIAPALPSFSFHPNPFFGSDGSVDVDSHNFARYSVSPPPQKSVGLLEPKNNSFHHGNCTQIPKLRVACASGSHGQRTMWSHCEQCGAIEMIDSDY